MPEAGAGIILTLRNRRMDSRDPVPAKVGSGNDDWAHFGQDLDCLVMGRPADLRNSLDAEHTASRVPAWR